MTVAPKILRMEEYRRPDFTTDAVKLNLDIHEDHTIATSEVVYTRTVLGQGMTELVLNAENPNSPINPDDPNSPKKPYVRSVTLNGWELAEGEGGYIYDRANDELRISLDADADNVEVKIETVLEPQHNAALTGFYKADTTYLTQCEPQSFRRITPFLDRPDVMAKYTVRIEADQSKVSVLLSNGNKTDSGTLDNGRHWAIFHDPFPKPSYLFASANGDLELLEDSHTTKSGKNVALRIWTEQGKADKAAYAMESLKKAMKFDEDVFDCEYDLDNFNIVATSKFSFGAMENKGLNVFKDRFVLVDPKTVTDRDRHFVDLVIGHEYFHNWSGDRITLANFFNISLKEGLTVNREQMFTAHVTSNAIDRIENVQTLRARQFAEDDGPLAHPVMTKEAMSVENLYSGTIYQKGSEVIRMMKTMMGEESFINGVKHYFKKHDGQAVTINEFIKCMEETSDLDLSGQFRLWYTQSGRPRVKAEGHYDAAAKTYTLTLEQRTPPTKDQPEKQPVLIPVAMGLVDKAGQPIKLVLDTDTVETLESGAEERVLLFTEEKQTFVFENVESEPAFHSLLRGFSAPVDLDPGLSEAQLNAQLVHDTDGFNRWDASQKLALREMKRLYDGYTATGRLPDVSPRYIATIRTLANDTKTDPALAAKALGMPDVGELENLVQPVAPAAVAAVRRHLKETFARELPDDFEAMFRRNHDGKPYEYNYAEAGKRALKGIALSHLAATESQVNLERARDVFFDADNMTDKMSAMSALRDHPSQERDDVYQAFFDEFKDDPLTIQKWFVMQASANAESTIGDLRDLMTKDFFDWKTPDHPRALVQGLTDGYEQFHRPDGNGYEFVADAVIRMDAINPMIAARLVEPLCNWQKYSGDHQQSMIAALERIAAQPEIKVDLKERLIKSLPEKKPEGFSVQPVYR